MDWCKLNYRDPQRINKFAQAMIQQGYFIRLDVPKEESIVFSESASIYRLRKDNDKHIVNSKDSKKKYPPVQLVLEICKLLNTLETQMIDIESPNFNFKENEQFLKYLQLLKSFRNVFFLFFFLFFFFILYFFYFFLFYFFFIFR